MAIRGILLVYTGGLYITYHLLREPETSYLILDLPGHVAFYHGCLHKVSINEAVQMGIRHQNSQFFSPSCDPSTAQFA